MTEPHVILGGAGEPDAMEQEEVLLGTIAGNSKIVAGGGVGNADAAGLFPGELNDAGIEGEQQVVVASVDRESFYFFFADEAGDVLRGGVDEYGVAFDFDLLGDFSNFEGDVDSGLVTDDEENAGADLFGEAGLSDAGVSAINS